jgi:hypothetical protein
VSIVDIERTLRYLMANNQRNTISDVVIRFGAPEKLRSALQELANERNITLSALLRLITTEYVKRSQTT